ncbi:Carboxylic ester hydrolase [Sergentomyia squamirostris]
MKDKANIVIVQPPCGPLKGITEISSFGYEYANFYDVPYAKPALGALRFKDPEPLESWTDLLDASRLYNPSTEERFLNEDCMRLNIYTKNARLEGSLHPVLLTIAGGAFRQSPRQKNMWGPEILLQKDVLLVVMSHRTGSFGFLSSDDPVVGVPGNAGLKDQVMALRWIQENIATFGGDPNDVTILGCSSGACSVHYHMMSPLSKGLFHKVIIMSGSAYFPRGLMPKLNWATRLARKIGWHGSHSDEASAFDFLRSMDSKTIRDGEKDLLTDQEKSRGLDSIFGPVIESYRSRMCLIPEHPDTLFKHAWSHAIPLMIGGVKDEGLFSYKDAMNDPDVWNTVNQNPSTLLPYNLTQDPVKRRIYGEKLKLFYFGRDDASKHDIDSYVKMMGDKTYWYSVYKVIVGRLKYPEVGVRGSTWLYRFSFESEERAKHRILPPWISGDPGVAHVDDMLYLYSNGLPYGLPKSGTAEFEIMQLMVEIYTSFITNGDPNNDELLKVMGKWKPISCSFPLYGLKIDNPPMMIDLPEKERIMFWDAIYKDAMESVNEYGGITEIWN